MVAQDPSYLLDLYVGNLKPYKPRTGNERIQEAILKLSAGTDLEMPTRSHAILPAHFLEWYRHRQPASACGDEIELALCKIATVGWC